jgi:hypothetical protein
LGAVGLGGDLGAGVRVDFDADGGGCLGIAAVLKQPTNLTIALQRTIATRPQCRKGYSSKNAF